MWRHCWVSLNLDVTVRAWGKNAAGQLGDGACADPSGQMSESDFPKRTTPGKMTQPGSPPRWATVCIAGCAGICRITA